MIQSPLLLLQLLLLVLVLLLLLVLLKLSFSTGSAVRHGRTAVIARWDYAVEYDYEANV